MPMSAAPVPLESVARWKRSVKPAPVLPVPVFAIVAESETGVPAVAVEGVMPEAERSEAAGAVTVTLLLHDGVMDWDPEVMVTLPVFVPAVVYAFDTDALEPERLSVPPQEYAYAPVPPDAVADQVTLAPVVADVGKTAHEPAKSGSTATVAVAVEEPPALVHVRVYVVVAPGATDLLPAATGESEPTPLSMDAAVELLLQEYVRRDELPTTTDVGFAVRVATGFVCTTPVW